MTDNIVEESTYYGIQMPNGKLWASNYSLLAFAQEDLANGQWNTVYDDDGDRVLDESGDVLMEQTRPAPPEGSFVVKQRTVRYAWEALTE